MKNCDEMVNSLLERRDQYLTKQKKKRKVLTRTLTSMCCACLVALLGFGMWQGGIFFTTSPITIDDPINIGDKNYIDSDGDEKTIISSFDMDVIISASYETPDNGKFNFSIPLRNAMNKYKDDVLYRVIVNVFSDKEMLSTDSSQIKDECERLLNNGYIVAYETSFDREFYQHHFTLHATYEELTKFIANVNYGYFMFLYDERVES